MCLLLLYSILTVKIECSYDEECDANIINSICSNFVCTCPDGHQVDNEQKRCIPSYIL